MHEAGESTGCLAHRPPLRGGAFPGWLEAQHLGGWGPDLGAASKGHHAPKAGRCAPPPAPPPSHGDRPTDPGNWAPKQTTPGHLRLRPINQPSASPSGLAVSRTRTLRMLVWPASVHLQSLCIMLTTPPKRVAAPTTLRPSGGLSRCRSETKPRGWSARRLEDIYSTPRAPRFEAGTGQVSLNRMPASPARASSERFIGGGGGGHPAWRQRPATARRPVHPCCEHVHSRQPLLPWVRAPCAAHRATGADFAA